MPEADTQGLAVYPSCLSGIMDIPLNVTHYDQQINEKIFHHNCGCVNFPVWRISGRVSEPSSFRRRLAYLRRKAGLSQEALAEKSGLSRNFIGLLESGRRNPSLATALQIQRALGAKLEDLVTEAGEPLKAVEKAGAYKEGSPFHEYERLMKRFSKCSPREMDVVVKMLRQVMRMRRLSSSDQSH